MTDDIKKTYQEANDEFVERLISVCRDRGHRAELRRWWSSVTRPQALPVLGRLGALSEGTEHSPRTVVSALYAAHASDQAPAHRAGGNSVGQAALKLAGGSVQAEGFESMERHFRRLLTASAMDDLASQLHRLIKRLTGEGIPLDYNRLLGDLRQFSKSPEKVRTRWALGFWQAPNPETLIA